MPDWGLAFGLAVVAGVASWGGTGFVLRALRARRILDEPNPRSSHTEPTPRGGGIAVISVIAVGLMVYALIAGGEENIRTAIVIAGAMAFLAVVSWIDDLRTLSPFPRLGAQFIAVGVVGWLLFGGTHLQGEPASAIVAVAACAIGWLWFLNLFNFMDGIDGIAGVETIGIGIGLAVLAAIVPRLAGLAAPGLLLAAAALGFLVWNWHPARIFLGDVGSVPLGFAIGLLLILLVVNGYWLEALILPLYYWADATLTIGRRMLRGHAPWQAHREHFYQRAVAGGLTHGRVSLTVAGANAALVGSAALAASGWPIVAALLAVVVVASVLCYFGLTGARAPR